MPSKEKNSAVSLVADIQSEIDRLRESPAHSVSLETVQKWMKSGNLETNCAAEHFLFNGETLFQISETFRCDCLRIRRVVEWLYRHIAVVAFVSE